MDYTTCKNVDEIQTKTLGAIEFVNFSGYLTPEESRLAVSRLLIGMYTAMYNLTQYEPWKQTAMSIMARVLKSELTAIQRKRG